MKYPAYKFENLKTCFENLRSTRDFVTDEKFLGGIILDIKSHKKILSADDLYNAVLKVLSEIAPLISKPNVEYEGTTQFYPHNINKIFTDKTVNYSSPHDGGLGVSQNDSSVEPNLKIDLTFEDWFAQTDNFGTSEEKALVAYFKDRINQLQEHYKKIFLVRNERQFGIYSFEKGERFEPDYVLFLQKNNDTPFEQLQIFIEPKGTHLSDKDRWKENFLLQLKDNAVSTKKFVDDTKYSIWGFHFFNRDDKKIFDDDLNSLI